MKLISTILAVLALSLPSYAQLLWPVKGADIGSNIISRPQHYVDGELNFGLTMLLSTSRLAMMKAMPASANAHQHLVPK